MVFSVDWIHVMPTSSLYGAALRATADQPIG